MQATDYGDAPQSPNSPSPVSYAGLLWLLAAAAATVILWQVPGGNYVLYPFTLLATWFHEMGHGLTALALGGQFHHLEIYANGSGLATHSGPLFLGQVGKAIVAAGGPMGPALAGAAFIIAGRYYRVAHYALYFLGAALILSALIWVRSAFGFMVVGLLGAVILLIAYRGARWFQGFMIQFLGVQACVSVWQQVDYLFTHSAEVGGQRMLSDTSHIAQNLFLPYWFWGGLIAILTVLLLLASLGLAARK